MTVCRWQDYHLKNYLNGITALEAFQNFGMGARIHYFQDMGQFWHIGADFTTFSTDQWRDMVSTASDDTDDRVCHHTIHTPTGTLTYKTRRDPKTTWMDSPIPDRRRGR